MWREMNKLGGENPFFQLEGQEQLTVVDSTWKIILSKGLSFQRLFGIDIQFYGLPQITDLGLV